jgi:hypothetical protein
VKPIFNGEAGVTIRVRKDVALGILLLLLLLLLLW